MAWASAVTCSSIKGNAKTSMGGMSNETPRLFHFKTNDETIGEWVVEVKMNNKLKVVFLLFVYSILMFAKVGYTICIHSGRNVDYIPVDTIDSIIFRDSCMFVSLKNNVQINYSLIDSLSFCEAKEKDTLFLVYEGESVAVSNPLIDKISVISNDSNANVFVFIRNAFDEPVICVNGYTNNGSLKIDSEIDYKLVLNGVSISSLQGPAFNSVSKQKVFVELVDGTNNSFIDNNSHFVDTTEVSNGCFNVNGAVAFCGSGMLSLEGNYKHAVYSKKSITFYDGTYNIVCSKSDVIHSGKNISINGGNFLLSCTGGDVFDLDGDFCMADGCVNMSISGVASKGIKCKGTVNLNGGSISALADGKIKNNNGKLSYCSIFKCDSIMVINGGDFNLVNNSPGGKCISVDGNLYINGGTLSLTTHGDGCEYINEDNVVDYYTSKCVVSDDSLFINDGIIECLSTGIGGKGIVAEQYISIGKHHDIEYLQGPCITVKTTNSCIVNDIDEDVRYGCPKAIKSSTNLDIYSGKIYCHTLGMGGEGVECGKFFNFYGGSLECDCYDDGINIGEKFEVLGGKIYCNSIDNDGIDSNGSVIIRDGMVISVNQKLPNESIDTEGSDLHVYGGTVIGIGSANVKMGEQPCLHYNTQYNNDVSKPISRGLKVTCGKYISIMDEDRSIISVRNLNENRRVYVTAFIPEFRDGHLYRICEGDSSSLSNNFLFHENVILDSQLENIQQIMVFMPMFNNNF